MNADNNVIMARGERGQGLRGGKQKCVCVGGGVKEENGIISTIKIKKYFKNYPYICVNEF